MERYGFIFWGRIAISNCHNGFLKLNKDTSLLEQQRSEIGRQVLNQIRHTLERFDHRCTIDNPRFAERYMKGELQLIIHFSVRGIDKQFVACLRIPTMPITHSDL